MRAPSSSTASASSPATQWLTINSERASAGRAMTGRPCPSIPRLAGPEKPGLRYIPAHSSSELGEHPTPPKRTTKRRARSQPSFAAGADSITCPAGRLPRPHFLARFCPHLSEIVQPRGSRAATDLSPSNAGIAESATSAHSRALQNWIPTTGPLKYSASRDASSGQSPSRNHIFPLLLPAAEILTAAEGLRPVLILAIYWRRLLGGVHADRTGGGGYGPWPELVGGVIRPLARTEDRCSSSTGCCRWRARQRIVNRMSSLGASGPR